jgi:beta-lactam-binding protein with PASTA domain
MSVFKNIFNKEFGKHLGIVALSGTIIIVLIFFALNLYTRHGNAFKAPDLTGLTEKQLSHLIEKKELRYTIIDSTFLEEATPGVVIEQTPSPGSLIKKNRKIFLTINSWSPEKVQVTYVMDYSIRNARVMLESFGLKVGELIYVPSEYTNLVLGQHYQGKPVSPGTPLERGATIDLLVGQGLSNRTTAVPVLSGLRIKEATKLSQDLSLNIGATIYDSTVVSKEDTLNAFIWKQRPKGSLEVQLRLGSSIDIWLTTDSANIEPDSAAIESMKPFMQENEPSFSEDDSEKEKFF